MQPMAGRRRLERKTDDRRPVVTDDFIYDDPQNPSNEEVSGTFSSDTPEEAIRKLKSISQSSVIENESGDNPADSLPGPGRKPVQDVVTAPEKKEETASAQKSSGKKKTHAPHPILRGLALILVTVFLLGAAAAFIFHRINPQTPYLDIPERLITSVVTPVQSFFSGITETVFGYFRERDLRANIAQEYNNLIQQHEQLIYKAMQADQLSNELAVYERFSDEIRANQEMKPLDCRIIGKSDSNYFSTLTIDKGTADGVTNDMAVTYNYSLIGYTYNTTAHTSTVITIINTDASIEALIQTTRDQGTVSGTLAVNGKPQCRMHYTPDESLPKPGDQVVTSGIGKPFPKGILIGTVEESTRGSDESKQYIVLNPSVDFQHLDHVKVLLYKFVSDNAGTSLPLSGTDTPSDVREQTDQDNGIEYNSESVTFGEMYSEADEESYADSDSEPYADADDDAFDESFSEEDDIGESDTGESSEPDSVPDTETEHEPESEMEFESDDDNA